MISLANVVKIFSDRASNLSSTVSNNTTSATSITNRECEVADLLCNVLESITSSHSHSFEVETTLDHDLVDDDFIDDAEREDISEETSDPNWKDEDEDEDEDKVLCQRFSLDYMAKAVEFYDEINPQTGKRKRRWETVKHRFQRIPHQIYLSRFRRYLEKNGTKKQKLDKIDDYVFDLFERAREKGLPVHDIDLRRWALKQAMDESLHNFAASKHWLHTFKHKHNIVSRKVTKVRGLKFFIRNVRRELFYKNRSTWTRETFKVSDLSILHNHLLT